MTALRRRLAALQPGLLLHPVFVVFLLLTVLYGWQAWRRGAPWLFTDELEFTQLSRSVAESGELTRRGEAYERSSYYPYVIAPAWLLGSTATGYEAAKWIGTVAMTATIFPAYALGRLLLARPYAIVAAAATVMIPSLVYTSFLVEEPLAYFWSTLALYLLVRALASQRALDLAAAVVVTALAPGVRDQLAMLIAVFVAATLWLLWTSDAARRHRGSWSRADWLGLWVFVAGGIILFNAYASHASGPWEIATRLYKLRMLEYGLWAAGALAIGMGILPFVAGLTALWRPRLGRLTAAERAFWPVFIASVAAFGFYTAVKAAFLSATFATRVVERNLIYVAPLLFVAAALLVERRAFRVPALAAASALTLFLIVTTPYQLETRFYSDSPGLAVLAWGNRTFAWTPERAQTVLLWMLVASVAVLLAVVAARRAGTVAAAVAAALALGWSLTGQVAGANASIDFADLFLRNLPKPLDWVDRATGGRPALFLGQQIDDPNGVHFLEFWNKSIKRVWSMDGTAPGPGPTLSPNITTRYGTLSHYPGYPFVVAEKEVELVGDVVAEKGGWRLYRIDRPLRVEHSVTGLMTDGWVGSPHPLETVTATYSRYSTPGERAGTALVTVSRSAWCGASAPANVEITLGPLQVNDNAQPVIGTVTEQRTWVVDSCLSRTFRIPTPAPPFHVQVQIGPTFVPAELEPGNTERRHLGAVVDFDFEPY